MKSLLYTLQIIAPVYEHMSKHGLNNVLIVYTLFDGNDRDKNKYSHYLWALFFILHIDLTIPGYLTDRNEHMALMNTMCDMSQCVVVAIIPNTISVAFAHHISVIL